MQRRDHERASLQAVSAGPESVGRTSCRKPTTRRGPEGLASFRTPRQPGQRESGGGTVCSSCQSGPAPPRLPSRPTPPLGSGAGRARCGGRCCCFLGPFCSARRDERCRAGLEEARAGGNGGRRASRIRSVWRGSAIAGEGGRGPFPGPCIMSWGTELWVSEGPGHGRPGREARRGASACVVAQRGRNADRVALAAWSQCRAGSRRPERPPTGDPRGRGARAVPDCVIARAPGRSSGADLCSRVRADPALLPGAGRPGRLGVSGLEFGVAASEG